MKRYLGRDKSAVLWREWLGLICAFLWFFGSMYSYYEPLFTGIWTELLFMLLLCVGLAGTALLWGKYPKPLERALPYATLAGAVCTGLIPFLPVGVGKAVFWLSALLMTPLLCRRLYGVLRCAKNTSRIRTYISAVSVTIVLQMVWALLPLSFAVKFPVLSAFALLGLWRAESHLPAHERAPLPHPAAAGTSSQLARIAGVFLLLVVLSQFNSLIHYFVVTQSMESNDWLSLLSWLLAPTSFLFFAYFSDKNRERLGFLIGMALVLAGCFVALTPNNGMLATPLLMLGEFGGTITEFCFLTMPLLFFPFSKRPLLVAVSGLIAHTLLSSAVGWTQELWLPQEFLSIEISRSLIIFGAVCAAALIPLAFSVWRRQEDATLMAALLGLKKQTEQAATLPEAPAISAAAAETPVQDQSWAQPLDLLEGEHRVVQLLCEGLSRAEIAERLELSPAKIAVHLRNIRVKLDGKHPLGFSPEVVRLAGQYGLTGRETEVLNELLLGRSNAEIAANLHIEEPTVKTHVGRVLKKVGAAKRSELLTALRG
jgi:DNA-binding CsgD family transcriptional regulator